jgi:peptidoglycan/LPS O-acetylase OafA/YrhL
VKYRPEIDGLRAIAVTAVILYHVGVSIDGFNPFQGGFIGVDIFFVISGYLITSILLREMASNEFTFVGFYERRARRILPALFVVMFTSIPFAWMYMFPKAFKEYADSIVASTLFVSNFFFWREGTYTAEASGLKPLLHVWSLSVEEQFYVMFPIMLLLCWRFAQKHITLLFVVMLLASLVLADWASHRYVNASFFLLPSRGWELLAGALLARIEYERGRASHRLLHVLMPAVGLLLIAYSMVYFNDQMVHPGFQTLVPIAGTMLLIWFSGGQDLISKVLSTRLFVGIGLISYSLYLWHQPIFAFVRLSSIDALSGAVKAACVLASFILAWLTWWVIEKVFRDKKRIGRKTLWFSLFVAAVLLVLFGVLVDHKNGVPERFNDLPPTIARDTPQKSEGVVDPSGKKCMNRDPKDACVLNGEKPRPSFAIVGDSHARVLSKHAYDYAKKNEIGFVELTMSGCAYLPNAGLYVNGKADSSCTSNYQAKRFDALTRIPPGTIVLLAGRLPMYLSGTGFDNGEGGVEAIGSYLSVNNASDNKSHADINAIANDLKIEITKLIEYGHRIVLVYPIPEVGWSLPQKFGKSYLQQRYEGGGKTLDVRITTSYERFHERSRRSYLLLGQIGLGDSILRVYPETVFCSRDQIRCETHNKEDLFYVDSHHLSDTGSLLLFSHIEKEMEKKWGSPNRPNVVLR